MQPAPRVPRINPTLCQTQCLVVPELSYVSVKQHTRAMRGEDDPLLAVLSRGRKSKMLMLTVLRLAAQSHRVTIDSTQHTTQGCPCATVWVCTWVTTQHKDKACHGGTKLGVRTRHVTLGTSIPLISVLLTCWTAMTKCAKRGRGLLTGEASQIRHGDTHTHHHATHTHTAML
eukprot:m.102783 g.102783  ORF g.102783 m.102783 type:complete len:173 (-) comp10448_c0_seq3:16-534(-)